MEKKKIAFQEVDRLSRKLAEKAAFYQPDCVISIERGGCYIGEIIAGELNLPHYSVRMSKWYYKVPRWFLRLVRFIRSNAPWPFNNIFESLVNWVSCSLTRIIKPKPAESFNGFIGLKARILLVDDDIGVSGLTMQSTLDYLQQRGFENIKTAAIRGDKSFNVDYSVAPTTPILLFPWPWRN